MEAQGVGAEGDKPWVDDEKMMGALKGCDKRGTRIPFFTAKQDGLKKTNKSETGVRAGVHGVLQFGRLQRAEDFGGVLRGHGVENLAAITIFDQAQHVGSLFGRPRLKRFSRLLGFHLGQ